MELHYGWVLERENSGNDYGSRLLYVLKSLKFRLLPKNRPREWRVGFEDFCVCTLVFG